MSLVSKKIPLVAESETRRVDSHPVTNHPALGSLTSLRPLHASEIWTRKQWIALAFHLHNENSPTQWVMGFFGLDRKQGGKPGAIYVKSKTVHVAKAIQWAWSSLCGKGSKKIVFTPYSQNDQERSRWASVDFDAHTNDSEEAQKAFKWAYNFFLSILNTEGIHVILEASGRGWHVWMISKEFHTVAWWFGFVMLKLRELGVDTQVEKGVIEIFPRPSAHGNECGFAMRAPGSWNPNTDTANQILWEDVTILINELVSLNKENRDAVSRKRKKFVSLAPLSSLDGEVSFLYPRLVELLKEYQIKLPNTRHKRLEKLVGEVFYQVGETMAERFILEQFKQKMVATKATEQDHLEEFGSLWAGLHRIWLSGLYETEVTNFESLGTDAEHDAFRIIHSYAAHVIKQRATDFAIGRDDFGARLGITGVGAGKLIQRFIGLGIIDRVRECVPHKFAARYVWLLEPIPH